MFNCHTGFKIAVQAPVGGAPYVFVPDEQVGEVRRLFVEQGIGHTVGSRLAEHNDERDEQVIHIGTLWDAERIQDALDSVH
jgi:hypothetical protein